MDNNSKDTKHTRYIYRRMRFLRNSKELNFHQRVWCERGVQLAYIRTNNGRGAELNHRLGYSMVILEN